MEIALDTGFNYLENCNELTDQEKDNVRELTVKISVEDEDSLEHTFLDYDDEIVAIIEVDGDEVSLIELNIDQTEID